MAQLNPTKAELWKYDNCEFESQVGGHRVRVILKSADSKHAHVSNYYHRTHTYKIDIKSFLKTFTLVQETTRNV